MQNFRLILIFLSIALIQFGLTAHASDDLTSLENFRYGADHISSAQPSAEHLRALAAQGVTVVINFRDDALAEEPSWATAAGMAYYHIPIADGNELSAAKVAQLDQLFNAIAGQKALLHCSTGNRAAAMLALHAAWHQNASVEQALAIGQHHGLDSETLLQRVQELLKR